MIANDNQKTPTRVFNRDHLESYWGAYFSFERNTPALHSITENLLLNAVEEARTMERPFIDSQQVIGKILTELGSTHNFHRQFNESFPELKPNYVLGMQLYRIMVEDADTWVYHETRHPGHVFPHATYFIARASQRP
ncbi:MAG: hypothetical protein V1791_03225 [Pseudomonadota bacterium]